MDISANLSRIARSFEWLWNNFLRSSWDSTCLIASEQYSWGFLFLGPFWVRNLKICLVNPPVLGSNRFWLLVRTFVYQSFISNLSFEISHFTGKTTPLLSGLQGLFPSSDWFDLRLWRKISKSYGMRIPRTFLWNNSFFLSFLGFEDPT